jgi:hypothetical protein
VAEFTVSPRFAREWWEWQKAASPRDLEGADQAMAAIIRDPALAGRVRSFYDPQNPTFLYRFENLIVHYRVSASGTIEFLNLFPR